MPMPAHKRRRGPRPDIVEAVGLIPFYDDPVYLLKTVLSTLRSFERSEPVAPICAILIWKLATAGTGALGLGGDAAGPGKPFIAKRRHPATLELHAFLGRIARWIDGDDGFDCADVVKLKALVLAGLEACGFSQTAVQARFVKPSGPSSADRVRYLVAQAHDDVSIRRKTDSQVIAESARQSVLRRKRSWLAQNGRDPQHASIEPDDELEVAGERRTIERAYYRAKRMTDTERNARLAYLDILRALLL
jgi:hypothetical protein